MEKYIEVLKNCPLFKGMGEKEIFQMLDCLKAKELSYKKEEFVFTAGEKPGHIGVVLSGCVRIIQDDYWGNRMILTSIEPGNLFGEAFSCAEAKVIPFSALVHDNAVVIMIDYKRIITTCSSVCVFHTRLIRNMLSILANKNMMLTRKMEHITKKTTREKVLSYLSEQAMLAGRDTFVIPFNRQELADYLSVERSALSSTLGAMRDAGMIKFDKNRFTVIQRMS